LQHAEAEFINNCFHREVSYYIMGSRIASDSESGVDSVTHRRGYLKLLAGLSASLAGCADYYEDWTPLPERTARNALFGASVGIDGDTALIGAARKERGEEPDVDTEAVFVFSRENGEWTPDATLRPDSPVEGFGNAVALAGDVALVGGADDDQDTGTVYSFLRSTGNWSREARLTAGNATPSDRFGRSLAMDGDTAVIGAPGDDGPNDEIDGSAYVFERTHDGWTQQANLTGDNRGPGAVFGAAVAVDGNTAVIGAPEDHTPNDTGPGAAYIFVRRDQEWTRQAKLFVEHKLNGTFFAETVAADGDTALVGAPRDNTMYVFSRTDEEWSKQTELFPDDVEQREERDPGGTFAGSVALTTDVALIGAPTQDDGDIARTGSVYVFTRTENGWRRQAKLTDDGGDSLDEFGTAVALSGDTALATALYDEDTDGRFAGTAHTFVRSTGSWERQAELTASDGGPLETATEPSQRPSTSPGTPMSPSQNTTATSRDMQFDERN
jgi:ketosteroid isomerase-like protein